MRPHTAKRTVRAGGVSIGTLFFEFDTTGVAGIARIAAGARPAR